ncbi:MAG: hypothetical protein DME86_05610, partial [Verrucomicrobia bacterium]
MDRTAWIAVTLCVLGLVAWEIYVAKQRLSRPIPADAILTPTPALSETTATGSSIPASAPALPQASPRPAPVAFVEKTETLRNSDIELHLTSRGGGISEVVLLRYAAEENKRVTLNLPDRLPIGAILQDPATPNLPEYKLSRTGDAVRFEYVTPANMTIRKTFSFAPAKEKDNYLAHLDVDFVNGET